MARPIPWPRDLTGPLHALQGELSRLFDEYLSPSRLGPAQSPPVDLEPAAWTPAVDLYETPSEIVLTADLPGVDPASIDLSLTGNVLSLRGKRDPDTLTETASQAALRERPLGTFHRQLVLSSEVNLDAVQAEARNGVLRVRIPKQEAARPRTIPVQAS